jgi:type III secretion protein V
MILSNMIDWGQRERDALIITEQIRRGLFEQITHQNCVSNVLHVISLDSDFEQFVRENLRSDGVVSFLDVDSPTLNKILEMVVLQYKAWAHLEKMPVILCSMDTRPHFKALIQEKLKSVPVMSFQEVSSSRELQFLGTITFDESLLDNDNNRDMVGQ